jgi:thiol-disulfide isomerase/thioredoxin
MKKVFILPGLFVTLFLSSYLVVAATKPPGVGGVLPEIILSVPPKPEHQKYLGLAGEGRFIIPQIKAEVVLLEIFSMYCPYCQNEAPIVNELYRTIENNRNLKEKVKLIGIGAGNSSFEVDVFRKKYNIEFPLFPDSDFSIHKIVGEVRTPYFIGVKIGEGGAHSIFYSKLGGIENPDKFISLILDLSGI